MDCDRGFELQASFRSAQSLAKLKLVRAADQTLEGAPGAPWPGLQVVDGTAELTARVRGLPASFSASSGSLGAHLDFGFLVASCEQPVDGSVLNPYLKLAVPRDGSLGAVPAGNTVFGALLHWQPQVEARCKLRAHVQLKLLERATGTQMSLAKKLVCSWAGWTFAAFDDYSLTEGRSVDTRLSLACAAAPFQGFLEADFVHMARFTGVTAGCSFSPVASLKLSCLWNRYFEHPASASAFALDYLPSGRASLRLLHYLNGKTAARLDYHLSPQLSFALLANVHRLVPEAALSIRLDV